MDTTAEKLDDDLAALQDQEKISDAEYSVAFQKGVALYHEYCRQDDKLCMSRKQEDAVLELKRQKEDAALKLKRRRENAALKLKRQKEDEALELERKEEKDDIVYIVSRMESKRRVS